MLSSAESPTNRVALRRRSNPAIASDDKSGRWLLSSGLDDVRAIVDYVAGPQLAMGVETFRTTVEGTFVNGLDKRERRKVLTFALRQLSPAEKSTDRGGALDRVAQH